MQQCTDTSKRRKVVLVKRVSDEWQEYNELMDFVHVSTYELQGVEDKSVVLAEARLDWEKWARDQRVMNDETGHTKPRDEWLIVELLLRKRSSLAKQVQFLGRQARDLPSGMLQDASDETLYRWLDAIERCFPELKDECVHWRDAKFAYLPDILSNALRAS